MLDGKRTSWFDWRDRPLRSAWVGASLGCIVTLAIAQLGLSTAITSAIVTLVVCWVVDSLKMTVAAGFYASVYGGSFAGMTDVNLFRGVGAPEHWQIQAIAAVCVVVGGFFALIYHLDRTAKTPLAGGFGGRLGAIAFTGTCAALLAAHVFGADVTAYMGVPSVTVISMNLWALKALVAAFGAVATLKLLRSKNELSPAKKIIFATTFATVGLSCLYVLSQGDGSLMGAFYAGCFLGMSAPERIPSAKWAVLGGLAIVPFLWLTAGLAPGVGGGLGLSAALAVAVLAATKHLVASSKAPKKVEVKSDNS
jgi:hypothetical protein